ncbi:hypothetical protein Bca52824_064968 [Brassica carinata]|uniref:Uncharacterized protein n=1 Tax=Brassica carinata TaxID=52824 RepID=A0A8X7QIK0_BRACI|nr:hypothetical protein Bca52824_064968 [Brassica carinata]
MSMPSKSVQRPLLWRGATSQFLDEADLPQALPEGVLPFYGSSPRRLSSVLNTVARTSLLDGPLKQLNKGGSRIAPFIVKRDANNHSRDNNDEIMWHNFT